MAINVNRNDFMKKFDLAPIYICFKGRLTECFIRSYDASEIFAKYSTKSSVNVLVDGRDHKIHLNQQTEEQRGEYFIGYMSDEPQRAVEISPSLELLLKHIKAPDDTREMLMSLSKEWSDDIVKKVNDKGHRVFFNDIELSCKSLKNSSDWDALCSDMRFYYVKNIMNPDIQDEVLSIVSQINHVVNKDNRKIEASFHFSGNKTATYLKGDTFNNKSVFCSKDCFNMDVISLSTSREHLVKKVSSFLEEKYKAWNSLSESKGLKVNF